MVVQIQVLINDDSLEPAQQSSWVRLIAEMKVDVGFVGIALDGGVVAAQAAMTVCRSDVLLVAFRLSMIITSGEEVTDISKTPDVLRTNCLPDWLASCDSLS